VDKFYEYGVNMGGLDPNGHKWAVARKAIACTSRFFKEQLHIPMTLREVGITSQDKFEIMAEKAAKGSVGSYVPLTKEDIIGIFKATF
jgi:alcohol dehydrogenase YqhD (iron-dependent ADH family)